MLPNNMLGIVLKNKAFKIKITDFEKKKKKNFILKFFSSVFLPFFE
jgi:hypothetical protein